MAATKTVTKKTNKDANVRIIATAASDTSTISLATDLKLTNEVTSGLTQKVIITQVAFTSSSSITVTRNSVVVATYHGTGSFVDSEFVVIDEPASDIVVTFAGAGMINLKLKKFDGYTDPIETGAFGIKDNPAVVGS
jgi:hypothetical protein